MGDVYGSWRISPAQQRTQQRTRSNQHTNAQHTATANLDTVFPHAIEGLDIVMCRKSLQISGGG